MTCILLTGLVLQCASGSSRGSGSVDSTSVDRSYEEASGVADGSADADDESPHHKRMAEDKSKDDRKPQVERMMIYEARQSIQVRELDSAVARTRALVKQAGGYIENQSIQKRPAVARFRLRIPVKKFPDILRELRELGQVRHQNIKAQDITREFADLSQRLKNRTQLRTRLYQILKKTKETKQRIRILNQIARLDKEIDSMQARRKHLARKAAFSTIDLELIAEKKLAVHNGSAIYWVRQLNPARAYLQGLPDFTLPMPSGFIDNSEDHKDARSQDLYFSPGGIKIRAASVDNDPRGDAAFYARAILFERQRYPEKILSHKQVGNRFDMTTPQQVGYQQAYYTIALLVTGERLHLVEVYYPTKELYDAHHAAVNNALAQIHIKNWFVRALEVVW